MLYGQWNQSISDWNWINMQFICNSPNHPLVAFPASIERAIISIKIRRLHSGRASFAHSTISAGEQTQSQNKWKLYYAPRWYFPSFSVFVSHTLGIGQTGWLREFKLVKVDVVWMGWVQATRRIECDTGNIFPFSMRNPPTRLATTRRELVNIVAILFDEYSSFQPNRADRGKMMEF